MKLIKESITEGKSKAIEKTAKDLTNPPKVMQHRAKRDQERDQELKYRDIAKRNDESKVTESQDYLDVK